jgi:hypothetical protein
VVLEKIITLQGKSEKRYNMNGVKQNEVASNTGDYYVSVKDTGEGHNFAMVVQLHYSSLEYVLGYRRMGV